VLGLYLQVPFCSSICNYCNFNRGLFDGPLKARYVAALREEIRRAGRGEAVDTIYFGGGTPSLLEPAEIAALIDECRSAFRVAEDVEVTLETNPETASTPRLVAFRAAGVNRLSFGVQSFQDSELVRLGRVHSSARAHDAVTEARAAGCDNVSLDLMMWLPGQSLHDWLANVRALIDVRPEHVSFYLLELYPNAPLKDEMARAGWSQAPDEDAAAMYLEGLAMLDAAGYGQYEISNACVPDRASRHNMKYWCDGEWHGFGCGAHSTRQGVRWHNVSSTSEYVARIVAHASPIADRRRMTASERAEEAMFTGLRLARGVDVDEVGERYGVDVWQRFGPGLLPFVDTGVLFREGSRIRLSREGMLVANEVMQVFV
jgi:putative oxygen-independent coproporphyrinogen III oxidase